MTIVGVISDTHGLLREEAVSQLQGVDRILHAGDVGKPAILDALNQLAPTLAVRGNVDTGAWAEALPEVRLVEVEAIRIWMIHDLAALRVDPAAENITVVLSGHSHQPRVEWLGGVLYLNPGSAGPRRFRLPVCLGTLQIDGTRVEYQHHDLAES